jgi:hypothetical protein
VKIYVTINGTLDIEPDDFKRAKAMSPEDLLRVMILNNTKITTKVTEMYQKKEG